MKVGTKIIGGFAIGILLTIIIGVASVYNLSKVGHIVEQLATQEIPETSAVIETERAMWNTHVLSYEFDIKLDEQSKKEWFDQREKIREGADKILPIATALNHTETIKAANDVKAMLDEYSKIGAEYTILAMENKKIEQGMEKAVGEISKDWVEYINGQNTKIETSIEKQDLEDITARVAKLRTANDAIDFLNAVVKNQYEYYIHQDNQTVQELHANLDKLFSVSDKVLKISTSSADLNLIGKAIESAKEYDQLAEHWTENKNKQIELLKQSDAKAIEIIDLASATAVQADKDAYDIGMETVELVYEVEIILFVILFAAVIIGSVLAFFITRGITKPLNLIIQGLNEGANQVTSASEQVASSSQEMAEGSSQQAASIEETSSSMEEMASMTKQNSENAGQADTLMQDANKVVSTANESMGQLTQSMEDISKASEETSKIIKTIDEIAFQTNLLALNAAVEAARAGEAGAGFAVVADEVRNLAMRAADAAKDTAALIEGTVKKVGDGSELVSTTNDAFTQVSESTSKVGDLVSEISQASKEQASGIEQVNTGISEMDKVVQQNAANAEESASASEEMNAQAKQLKEYVEDLVVLVTGKRNQGASTNAAHHPIRTVQSQTKPQKSGNNKMLAHKEVSPDQVIPFDDEDFKDF